MKNRLIQIFIGYPIFAISFIVIAIFHRLPLEIFLVIKSLFNCGFCKKGIEFQNKNIIINSHCKCSKVIPINDIQKIIYGIKNHGYYFTVIKKGKIFSRKGEAFCEKCREVNIYEQVFYRKKLNQIKLLNEVQKYNILVIPSILKCEPHFLDECGTIYSYCIWQHNKYLLSVCKFNNDIIWTFETNGYKDNNFSIGKMLKNPQQFFLNKSKESKIINTPKYIIKVLDKKLTLERGYGLFPSLNGKIIENKIFYSHDEEEIKNRIKELFEKKKT